jgi:putative membrane protein
MDPVSEVAPQKVRAGADRRGRPGDGRGPLARLLLPGGEEPDPRFTLANERTFLAWMRTALAFLAGGIALAALPLSDMPPEVRRAVAVVLLCAGVLIAVGAAVRWARVERAMRHARPLPVPLIVPVLAGASAVACGGLLAFLWLG